MILSESDFKIVTQSTPLVSIDFVLENDNGEYLLGKRVNEPAKGFWFVPGGRIRKNEAISSAIERLSSNEFGVGLTYQNIEHMGVYEHFYATSMYDSSVSTHYVVLAYRVPFEPTRKLILPNEQHDAYKWSRPEDIIRDIDVHKHSRDYFESILALN